MLRLPVYRYPVAPSGGHLTADGNDSEAFTTNTKITSLLIMAIKLNYSHLQHNATYRHFTRCSCWYHLEWAPALNAVSLKVGGLNYSLDLWDVSYFNNVDCISCCLIFSEQRLSYFTP